jgi:hypothetical protein
MKVASKISDAFRVLISVLWFTIYAGGGAFLLAKQATANPNNVSPYAPLIIFIWVVGFFVGRRLIEDLFWSAVEFVNPKAEANSVGIAEISINIDSIHPIYSNKIATNFLRNDRICAGYNGKTNYNKKETGKIFSHFKNHGKIYKVPIAC